METIGDRIKIKRKESGMTQLELANKLNVTDRAVSKRELNDGNPDITLLPKIAEIFNVSIDYLLQGKETEKEIVVMSKLELCAKNDDPSMINDLSFNKDENGKRLMDYIKIYNSKKVLTALIDSCSHYQDYVNLFNLRGKDVKKTLEIILMCIPIDREIKVIKGIYDSDLRTTDKDFTNALRFNDSRNKEIVEGFKSIFRLLVKEYKNLSEAQKKYYFDLKENEDEREVHCWFNAYPYFVEYAIEESNEELYELLLNQIEKHNTWYDKSIQEMKNKYREYFKDHLVYFKGKSIALLESTYQYLIETKNFKLAYRVNNLLSKPHPKREIELLEVKNSNTMSEISKIEFYCVDTFMIVPEEVKKIKDLKLVKKILNENYVNYYEMIFKLIKNDKKKLYKFFIDQDLKEFVDLLMNNEIEELLEQSWLHFNYYAKGKLCMKQTFIITDDSNRLKLNAKYIINRELENMCNYASDESKKFEENKIIEYFESLKTKIFEETKTLLDAEEKEKQDKLERIQKTKGLTIEYFEELLSKNDKEMFIIKLCNLFDAILIYDYKITSNDFSERMKEFFDKGPKSRDCDDGWGYMILDTEYENNVAKLRRNKRELMNKLRIRRNSIVHPECNENVDLTIDELKECLEFVYKVSGGKMFNE